MRCQGICYGEGGDGVARSFPDKLLADLAGDAFHAGSCLACVLALLVTVAMGEATSEFARLARAVSGGVQPSDSVGAESTASGGLGGLDAIWGLEMGPKDCPEDPEGLSRG